MIFCTVTTELCPQPSTPFTVYPSVFRCRNEQEAGLGAPAAGSHGPEDPDDGLLHEQTAQQRLHRQDAPLASLARWVFYLDWDRGGGRLKLGLLTETKK